MGLFDWLTGGRGRWQQGYGKNLLARDWWQVEGFVALAAVNSVYGQEVVGESNFQEKLAEEIGDRFEKGVYWDVVAQLVFIDDNLHDSNAIGVMVGGQPAGYIPRKACVALRKAILEVNIDQKPVICKGQITGGWKQNSGERANYGLNLSLEHPLRIRTR